MTRVAITTCAKMPELQAGDELLATALRELGVTVENWVWDTAIPKADAVLFRSCWDYHDKVEAFRLQLDALDQAKIPTFNATSIVRWNLDKRYLAALHDAGIATPTTKFVEHDNELDNPAIKELLSSGQIVVKPAISCGGDDTFKPIAGANDAVERTRDVMRRRGVVMIQEFLRDIESGELSFIFIGGRFSHAVIKRAAPGEFRIHIEYGGTVEDFTPTPEILRQAQATYEQVAQGAHYARVDGVMRGADFIVMETELIEPELFFPHRPQAATDLAQSLISVLTDHSS